MFITYYVASWKVCSVQYILCSMQNTSNSITNIALNSEWNASCDRLLTHIQDPLLWCMNRLHKQRIKSRVGLNFVHWELIASLLFASCRNLFWVTCCWRAGIIVPSSEKSSLRGGSEVNHQYSFHGDIHTWYTINQKSLCFSYTAWSPGMP